jgi:chaperonin cofactor prefoldin
MQAYIRVVAIDAELQNIQVRLMTIRAMKPQLEQGLAEASAAYQQLESGKMILTVELTKAQIQLANGQQELAKGLTELEKCPGDSPSSGRSARNYHHGHGQWYPARAKLYHASRIYSGRRNRTSGESGRPLRFRRSHPQQPPVLDGERGRYPSGRCSGHICHR